MVELHLFEIPPFRSRFVSDSFQSRFLVVRQSSSDPEGESNWVADQSVASWSLSPHPCPSHVLSLTRPLRFLSPCSQPPPSASLSLKPLHPLSLTSRRRQLHTLTHEHTRRGQQHELIISVAVVVASVHAAHPQQHDAQRGAHAQRVAHVQQRLKAQLGTAVSGESRTSIAHARSCRGGCLSSSSSSAGQHGCAGPFVRRRTLRHAHALQKFPHSR